MDKQLGEKDKISGRWFFSDNETVRPFDAASTLPFKMAIPGLNRFLKLGWTRIFSDRLVNEARLGFNRFGFDQIPDEPITLADISARIRVRPVRPPEDLATRRLRNLLNKATLAYLFEFKRALQAEETGKRGATIGGMAMWLIFSPLSLRAQPRLCDMLTPMR
jgi:hypothetical protein